ncbi:Phage tail fiber protein [Azospirillum argentinense]|uniref:hypothetical protein n=1 Tax=Azospirillum argentinense TaxID=2970906 RepID=UPI0032DEDF35
MSASMPKSDYAAIRAPQRWDDSSCGWSRGSEWLFSGVAYKCLDASDGNAIWITDADGISPALSANGDGSSVTVAAKGSLTSRPLRERFGDTVNVLDFGAKGDGVTDDGPAFAAALAELGARCGGTLVVPMPVPTKFYLIGQTLQVGSPYRPDITIRIKGEGYNYRSDNLSATIKLADGVNGPMFRLPIRAGMAIFEDLYLDCNKAGQTAPSYGIELVDDTTGVYAIGCHLYRCNIINSRDGHLYVGTGRHAGHVEDCWLQYTGMGANGVSPTTDEGRHGIWLKGYDWNFNRVQTGMNAGDGVYCDGFTGVLNQVNSYYNRRRGLHIAATCGTVVATDCGIDNNQEHGVYVIGATGSANAGRLFKGLRFSNNSKVGSGVNSDMYLLDEKAASIIGCTFRGGPTVTPKHNIETAGTTANVELIAPRFGTDGFTSSATSGIINNSAAFRTRLYGDLLRLGTGSTTVTVNTAGGALVLAPNGYAGATISPAGTDHVIKNDGDYKGMTLRGAGAFAGFYLRAEHSRGTTSSPTAVASGDELFALQPRGHDGSQYVSAGKVSYFVDGTVSGGVVPTRATVSVMNKSGSVIERIRVDSDGNVTLGGTTTTRIDNAGTVTHRGATVIVDANSHLGLRPYTVATLPSAAAADRMISVSNGAGNRRLAVSDGTNWRWPDGTVVS